MSKHLRAPHIPPADKAKPWMATEEDRAEQPVFDTGKYAPDNPYIRAGLTPTGKMILHLKRNDRDRRPGTPIPFHEPDPDRFAKAEAIRKAILEQDARLQQRIAASGYNEMAEASARKARAEFVPVHKRMPFSIPDVPNPRTDLCCAPEEAAVKASRDGRRLYFKSAADAEQAFSGDRAKQRVKNALSGSLADPYGWRWTRLKSLRGSNMRNDTGKI